MFDRTIVIPRDITFRGDFTLMNKSGGTTNTIRQSDLDKLVDITSGIWIVAGRTLIVDNDKNISGINQQTNNDFFTFDISKNNDNDSKNLIFKRSQGNSNNKIELTHGNHIGKLDFKPYVENSYIQSASIEINFTKKL